MSSANLVVLASILAGMILFPLLVLGLVRWLIPAEEPVEDMVETGTESAPSTLGDFWDGLKPHLLDFLASHCRTSWCNSWHPQAPCSKQ